MKNRGCPVPVTERPKRPHLMFNTSASVSSGLETGSVKKVIILLGCILVAYLIADALTNVILILSGLKKATGTVVSFVVYAVIFFAVLQLLQKYTHIFFLRV